MPGRPTQPQELSFMFMKIMDEVYALQEGNREKRSKAGKSKKNKDIEKEKEWEWWLSPLIHEDDSRFILLHFFKE